MGIVKNFDRKSDMNRVRVRNFRQKQKIKLFHESRVQERIYSLLNIDESSSRTDTVNNVHVHHGEDYGTHAYGNDNDEKNSCFEDKLKYWAVHHRISARAINDLLAILIFAGFSFLPKDSRTLMHTPSKLSIKTVSNGKMWYYGVQKCLKNVFSNLSRTITITLDMNFDGFPVTRSSKYQFWPILAAIRGIHES